MKNNTLTIEDIKPYSGLTVSGLLNSIIFNPKLEEPFSVACPGVVEHREAVAKEIPLELLNAFHAYARICRGQVRRALSNPMLLLGLSDVIHEMTDCQGDLWFFLGASGRSTETWAPKDESNDAESFTSAYNDAITALMMAEEPSEGSVQFLATFAGLSAVGVVTKESFKEAMDWARGRSISYNEWEERDADRLHFDPHKRAEAVKRAREEEAQEDGEQGSIDLSEIIG